MGHNSGGPHPNCAHCNHDWGSHYDPLPYDFYGKIPCQACRHEGKEVLQACYNYEPDPDDQRCACETPGITCVWHGQHPEDTRRFRAYRRQYV